MAPTMTPSTTSTTPVAQARTARLSSVDVQYMALSCVMVLASALMMKLNARAFGSGRGGNVLCRIKWIAMLQTVSVCVSYATWIAQILVGAWHAHSSAAYMALDIACYASLVTALMCLYAFMAHRLYYTFRDSVFRMHSASVSFHALITLFIPLWYSSLIYLDSRVHFYLLFCCLRLLLISGGTLALILRFNANLFELLLARKLEETCAVNGRALRVDVSRMDKSVTMQFVAKQTLLGTITLSVDALFLCVLFMLDFVSTESTDTLWIMYEWLLGTCILVNLLCVYFGFKVNEAQYDTLCGLPHRKMMALCQLCVQRRIAGHRNKKQNYVVMSPSRSIL